MASDVFRTLTLVQGERFASMIAPGAAKAAKEEWAKALAGFHPMEIERGLQRVRAGFDWQLTSAAFAKLCRPALDAEFAFFEAGDCMRQRDQGEVGDWSHPAVFRAACLMSPEVRAQDYKVCRKRWEYTLQREFDKGWGEAVKAPELRIAHVPKVGPPSHAVRARIASILGKKGAAS